MKPNQTQRNLIYCQMRFIWNNRRKTVREFATRLIPRRTEKESMKIDIKDTFP